MLFVDISNFCFYKLFIDLYKINGMRTAYLNLGYAYERGRTVYCSSLTTSVAKKLPKL